MADSITPPPSATKAALRKRIRTARTNLSAHERTSRARAISEVLLIEAARLGAIEPAPPQLGPQQLGPSQTSSPKTIPQPPGPARVATYVPLPTEPDVAPFAAGLESAVWVPFAIPDQALRWGLWTPGSQSEAEANRTTWRGLYEPAGELVDSAELLELVDVIVVPALGIDSSGFRLGQGGGFYDRSFGPLGRAPLSNTPIDQSNRVSAWGVVYDEEVLPVGAFPTADFDLRLDAIVTPSGIRQSDPERTLPQDPSPEGI